MQFLFYCNGYFGSAAPGEDKVPSPVQNSLEPGIIAVIPRVGTAPGGVETPTSMADRVCYVWCENRTKTCYLPIS